ncbi:MAG: hypothetical protein APR63_03680 [Desulfuromonas sp. SDB]|nr:MAG: hypothetical protein APR63_03680 [Desulfuromonas sp. SDB]
MIKLEIIYSVELKSELITTLSKLGISDIIHLEGTGKLSSGDLRQDDDVWPGKFGITQLIISEQKLDNILEKIRKINEQTSDENENIEVYWWKVERM